MRHATYKDLRIVSGRSSHSFAEKVCTELSVDLTPTHISNFANGEVHVKYGDSIRGCDIFIICAHTEFENFSINDTIMEHLVMVDAAKRASAKRITAVAPCYGYARQDRKASGREPITARLLADLFLVAGAQRIVSVDLHSGQIQGFFNGPVDHLTAMPVLAAYLQSLQIPDLVIVSPDAGRVKVAERYTHLLNADLAIVHKRREDANKVSAKEIVGDVQDRTCIIIDDMIDTAGTIVAAAELLIQNGASSVLAFTTHPVFSGPAVARLTQSPLEQVVCTDTLPVVSRKEFPKLKVVSVAPLVAAAIKAIFLDTSVSEIFDGNNHA